MLSTWCEWHPYARKFLLGVSHLNMGEEEKALDLFISGAGGIPQDQFLTQDLLELQGSTPADLTVEYFLKVTPKKLTKKKYILCNLKQSFFVTVGLGWVHLILI